MDWLKTLGTLAPVIGSAFGPLGVAGGLAIKSMLGKEGCSDEELSAFLQTPEGVLKLKQAEYDYKLKIAQINLEDNKSVDADRADARKRDTKLNELGYKNSRADIMIVCVALSLMLDVILIAYFPDMKPEVLAIFNMMIGASLKMLGDAFQFEFGSSRGSKEKDLR